MAQLSTGALARALGDDTFSEAPIYVQVLDVQHITPKDGTGPKRTKVTVSDGAYKCTALLATQLKELVDSGQVARGAILEVRELVGNKKLGPAASKKLLIFLSLAVVGMHPETIGDPQPPPDGGSTAATSAPGDPSAAAGAGAAAGGGGGFLPAPGGGYGGPPPPMAAASNGAGMYGAPPPQQQQQQMFGMGGGGAGPYGGGGPAPGGGAPPPVPAGGPSYGHGPPGAAAAGAGAGAFGGLGPHGAGHHGGGGPVAHSGEPLRITPLRALNPYLGRWTAKARVTQKGDVRRWSNARGEGKLMSFDLVDKDGTEIRATAWNEQVDAYDPLVQVGRVVLISRASLKPRNPRFNSTSHEYEIYLERASTVTAVDEAGDADAAAIPAMMFSFRKLAELEAAEPGVIVDAIGVVDEVQGWALIQRKDGSETRKRSVTLRDDSGRSVEVTLWDKFVAQPGDQLEQAAREGKRPVLALKGVRVGDFNGKNLSTLNSSTVLMDPDRPEAHALRAWYDRGGGAAMAVQPLSERGAGGGGGGRQDRRVTLGQIKSEGLGMGAQADWVAAVATVAFIRNEHMTYPSCPRDHNGRQCQKKLADNGGSWWCERCQATVEEPCHRYLLGVQLADHTDTQWVTAFGDTGEQIMGRPAKELSNVDAIDSAAFSALINERTHVPYSWKLKVFQDTYGDEQRVKVSVSKVLPVDFAAEGRALLQEIAKLEGGGAGGAGPSAAVMGGGGMAPPPHQQPPMMGGGGGGGGPGGYGAPMTTPPGQPQQPPQYQQQGGGWGQQQQQQQQPPQQGGGGWGGPPPQQGGYGGPPPPQQGGYGGPPPQQQQQQPWGQQQQGGWGQPPPQQQQQQPGWGAPQQQAANQTPFQTGWA